MHTPSVYDYGDPREFLKATLGHKQERNPRFSLRAWARRLGYTSPSLLSAVLQGKRSLGLELVTRLADDLALPPPERAYLELSALAKAAKTPGERELLGNLLKTIRPATDTEALPLDVFPIVADWHYSALLELVEVADFRPDPTYLASRLEGGITPAETELALGRLLRLGLLRWSDDGKLRRASHELCVGWQVPSAAIRAHHEQMLVKAKDAIHGQTPDQRDLSGTTLAVRLADLPLVRGLVRELHDKLRKLSASGDADEVYRVNVQMFSLTPGGVDEALRIPEKSA